MALYAPMPTWDEQPEVTSGSVLKRDVPWDTYMAARLITDRDLRNIRQFDKATPQTQEDVLQQVGIPDGEGLAVVSFGFEASTPYGRSRLGPQQRGSG